MHYAMEFALCYEKILFSPHFLTHTAMYKGCVAYIVRYVCQKCRVGVFIYFYIPG